jgi:hypothetical protein
MTQNPFPNGSLQKAVGFGPSERNSFSTVPPPGPNFRQHGIEIKNVEVQVHWSPVSLVATHIGSAR